MSHPRGLLALWLTMIPLAATARGQSDMSNMPGMAGMPGMSMGAMTPKAAMPRTSPRSKSNTHAAAPGKADRHHAANPPSGAAMSGMEGMAGMAGMEGMKPTPKGLNRVISGPAEAALQAFSDALEVGNRDLAVKWLSPEAQIIEDGAAETRDAYVSHHMDQDMRRLKDAKRILVDRHVVNEGPDRARVISTVRLIGNRADQPFDTTLSEVATVERSSGEWRVARVEWHPTPSPFPTPSSSMADKD